MSSLVDRQGSECTGQAPWSWVGPVRTDPGEGRKAPQAAEQVPCGLGKEAGLEMTQMTVGSTPLDATQLLPPTWVAKTDAQRHGEPSGAGFTALPPPGIP